MLKIIDEKQLQLMLKDFSKESDRAITIVFIAVIDSILRDILHGILSQRDKKGCDDFLDSPHGLKSFTQKLKLCYLLGLIHADIYYDLKIINEFRNECAHHWNGKILSNERVDLLISKSKFVNGSGREIYNLTLRGFKVKIKPRHKIISLFLPILTILYSEINDLAEKSNELIKSINDSPNESLHRTEH